MMTAIVKVGKEDGKKEKKNRTDIRKMDLANWVFRALTCCQDDLARCISNVVVAVNC
jgi:hypothetical protein